MKFKQQINKVADTTLNELTTRRLSQNELALLAINTAILVTKLGMFATNNVSTVKGVQQLATILEDGIGFTTRLT